MLTTSDNPAVAMLVDDPDDHLNLMLLMDPDAIVEQIQQMISPHLGAVHQGGGGNGGGLDEDPKDWLDRDEEEEDEEVEEYGDDE